MQLVTLFMVLTIGLACDNDHAHLHSAQISTSNANIKPNNDPRYLPCPPAEDIYPCVCRLYSDYEMDLDCSEVTSEDQLAQIFSGYIPFKNFRFLDIRYNQYLKVLRVGDLGDASFQYIGMDEGILEVVQPGALSNSFTTAKGISFQENKIFEFPFAELEEYAQLHSFAISYNNIQQFPILKSATLTGISMDYNPMRELPINALQGLPNLEMCYLSGIGITEILPGTLTGFPHLTQVFLDGNHIEHIPAGVVHPGHHPSLSPFVSFSSNNISSIELDAVVGIRNGWFALHYNNLEVLDEVVFRPIFDEGAMLQIGHNPLDCGCSIAWLVTNPHYLVHLGPGAACRGGELLTDLDPGMYDAMC